MDLLENRNKDCTSCSMGASIGSGSGAGAGGCAVLPAANDDVVVGIAEEDSEDPVIACPWTGVTGGTK